MIGEKILQKKETGTQEGGAEAGDRGVAGARVFLTAPKDLQRTGTYERLLDRISTRHGSEAVAADRDLFESTGDWKKRWTKVYGPAKLLYVLAREDGTVGLGVWKQTRWLLKRGVPAVLVFDGAEDHEHEGFGMKRLDTPEERGEGEDLVRFAVVSLDPNATVAGGTVAGGTVAGGNGNEGTDGSGGPGEDGTEEESSE